MILGGIGLNYGSLLHKIYNPMFFLDNYKMDIKKLP